jgi:hypothetical protein
VGIHHFVPARKLDNRTIYNDFLAAYALLNAFPAMRQNILRMNHHIGLIVKVVKTCRILLAFIVAGLLLVLEPEFISVSS